ncbi:hypothetical protein D3C71_13190 [compost metagenome]
MNLNISQKLISLFYIFFLVIMLLFFTPFIKLHFGNQYIFYGNFFIEKDLIAYPKLLIQILFLTIIYLTFIIIFKSK